MIGVAEVGRGAGRASGSALGRNYADVTDVIREFIKGGIVIRTVINGLVFDSATKDPMQMAVRDALISFMAALSQAQAEATKEAQRAGIEHAKTRTTPTAVGSRPSRAGNWIRSATC